MPSVYTYTGPVIKPFTRLRAYGRDIVPSIWTQEQIQKWLAIEPRYAEFFTEVETSNGQVNDNALPPAPEGEPAQVKKGK